MGGRAELLPLMAGDRRDQPVLMEYAAEGSYALVAMVEGQFKFVRCQLTRTRCLIWKMIRLSW